MDRLSPAKRSKLMSRVRQKHTAPEVVVRKLLHGHGFRYRLHDKKLPGKPDIVLPRYQAAIFVNGCFWHGHECPRGKLPATRHDFWKKKINGNRVRDAANYERLMELGYRVLVVWECDLKNTETLIQSMIRFLQDEQFQENGTAIQKTSTGQNPG